MDIRPNPRYLLDSLTTAIIVADEHLRLIYVNTACENLLHISLNHITGAAITNIFREAETTWEKIIDVLTEGAHCTKRKAQWHLHNGHQITVDYTITPLTETQQILFEIRPLDRLLQISREESIIASQKTTRNLIRGLAHEVKNPLGGIRGTAQLLAKELSQLINNTELKDYTDIIINESDRLRNLVDRMLGPQQPIRQEAVNIHEILERVIALITAELEGDIHFRRNYDPSIPVIQGDTEILIQAILNIIQNARQALCESAKTSQPTIELTTRIHRQFTISNQHYPLVCCITIADNGPGIPDDIIDAIFYPMISGRADGSGLGLSISQHLINQHNGLIECISEPGNTRFFIYIPLKPTL